MCRGPSTPRAAATSANRPPRGSIEKPAISAAPAVPLKPGRRGIRTKVCPARDYCRWPVASPTAHAAVFRVVFSRGVRIFHDLDVLMSSISAIFLRSGCTAVALRLPFVFMDVSMLSDVTIRDTRNGLAASILIVEGDRDTLAGWVKLLHAAGYRVTGAASFEEARRALEVPLDLVITEVRLGAYNGLQLVIRARSHNPHLSAIVLTGFPDVVIRAEAERLNAIYVEKPVDAERLLTIVADALDRRPAV